MTFTRFIHTSAILLSLLGAAWLPAEDPVTPGSTTPDKKTTPAFDPEAREAMSPDARGLWMKVRSEKSSSTSLDGTAPTEPPRKLSTDSSKPSPKPVAQGLLSPKPLTVDLLSTPRVLTKDAVAPHLGTTPVPRTTSSSTVKLQPQVTQLPTPESFTPPKPQTSSTPAAVTPDPFASKTPSAIPAIPVTLTPKHQPDQDPMEKWRKYYEQKNKKM